MKHKKTVGPGRKIKLDEEHQCGGGGNFAANENTRTIFLFGEVDTSSSLGVVTAIHHFDSQSSKPINLVINNGGGDIDEGWAMYDAIQLSRSRVTAICMGSCMSAATLVLQACDQRLSTPNCQFMVHNGSVGYGAVNPAEFTSFGKQVDFLLNKYHETMIKKTNLTVEQFKELCEKTAYITPETALGYGLIDGIITQGVEEPVRKKRKTTKRKG